MPDTTPVVPMVATPMELLPHVPPVEVSMSVVVKPVHTIFVPVMAAGDGFIKTYIVIVSSR